MGNNLVAGKNSGLLFFHKKEDSSSFQDKEMPLLNQIFGNTLICDNIYSHLNFGDFLKLRELCALLKQSVTNSSHFLNKAILIMCKENVESFPPKTSTVSWQNLKIDVSPSNCKMTPYFANLLPYIKMLRISFRREDRAQYKKLIDFLVELFHTLPNLEHLEILDYFDIAPNPSFVNNGSRRFKKLRQTFQTGLGMSGKLTSFRISQTECISLDRNPFVPLMKEMNNLKVLDVRKFLTKSAKDDIVIVQELINRNKNTLHTVKINGSYFRAEDFETVKCSSLNNLTISKVDKSNDENVAKFLILQQSSLQRLDIRFRYEAEETLCSSILQSLQPVFIRLQNLNVKWCRHLCGDSYFVQSCNLQSFSIQAWSRDITTAKILQALPSQLVELCVKRTFHFWFEVDLVQSTLSNSQQIELISRFTQLQVLRLHSYKGDAVNDELMQGILRNLTRLKILDFSTAHDFTQVGITGRDKYGRQLGLSIKSLSGLTELGIYRQFYKESKSEGHFVNEQISAHFSFPYLRVFKYYPDPSIELVTAKFLETLAIQNPSLERIETNVDNLPCKELTILKKKLRKLNSNFVSFAQSASDWRPCFVID